jgi:hypothetical protein
MLFLNEWYHSSHSFQSFIPVIHQFINSSINAPNDMAHIMRHLIACKPLCVSKQAEVQSGFQSFAFFSQMLGAFFFSGVFALSTSDAFDPQMPQLTFVLASFVFLIAAVFSHFYFKKYPTDEIRVSLDSDSSTGDLQEGLLDNEGEEDDQDMLLSDLPPEDEAEAGDVDVKITNDSESD